MRYQVGVIRRRWTISPILVSWTIPGLWVSAVKLCSLQWGTCIWSYSHCLKPALSTMLSLICLIFHKERGTNESMLSTCFGAHGTRRNVRGLLPTAQPLLPISNFIWKCQSPKTCQGGQSKTGETSNRLAGELKIHCPFSTTCNVKKSMF